MEQVIEFFTNLFSTGDWPARWFCGKWSDFHGWLYIMSDIAIWLAYFFIPVIIIYFIQKKPNAPFLPVFWLFGAFIILCGSTHLVDALIFWWPGYRVSALLKLITAIVSLATVLALIRDLPKALDLSPDDELLPDTKDEELKIAKIKIEELNKQLKELKNQ